MAPRLIQTYLEDARNDFTGKELIPFATSTSTGIEKSVEVIRESVPDINVQEGMRFSSNASKEDVQSWLGSHQ